MWTEPILCVDMDSFFVEVERLDDPSLRGIPAAVGGTGSRGVIASASYEARAHGVHSAQSTAMAMRLCPDLRVVSPSHRKYSEVSVQVFEVLRSHTPTVEGISVDEAYLDVSGLRRHYSSPVEVGERVKAEIRGRLGLPSSVGVASNKLLAKLASEAAKPDGLRHVPSATQNEFLHALAVTTIPGVGPATKAALDRLGVVTVGDLAAVPEATLGRSVGPTLGRQLADLARGLDDRLVEPDHDAKSVSVEETYETDLEGRDMLTAVLAEHAHRLSDRLRRSGLVARTITLKVRYPDFETVTRSRTRRDPTDSWREVFAVAQALLDELAPTRPVRLAGLGASSLERSGGARQIALDADTWDRVEDAVFEVRERFGDKAIRPGRGLGHDG